MEVPFLDLHAQYKTLKKEIDPVIFSILNRAKFIQGPEVFNFENAFAKYLHVQSCISVNSGTDALIIGVRALGLSTGDEIIVPVNTFMASALGVSENGLKPVFVDIDNDDGINLEDLQRKITSRTKAIIVVHLYGRPDKIDEIQKIIKKTGRKIHIIEDACQAHGALYKGKRVGGFGIFSAFSFYPGKNLGAYGDGGAIVTNDKTVEKFSKQFREYGQKKKYFHETIGVNSRLDTLQAAVLLVKLKHLDEWNQKRFEAAQIYNTYLSASHLPITLPADVPERLSVCHIYPIGVKRRDALMAFLHTKGVTTLIHYPIPLHLQKAYASLGYKKGDFPVAEKRAKEMVSLPLYPEIPKSHIRYVVDNIKEFYKQ